MRGCCMTASLAEAGQVYSCWEKSWEGSRAAWATTDHPARPKQTPLPHSLLGDEKEKVLAHTWKQFLNGHNNEKNNDDNDNA